MSRICRHQWIRAFCNLLTWRTSRFGLLVFSLSAMWQCTQSPSLHQRIDLFMSRQWSSAAPLPSQITNLTFDKAFGLAVRQDERILQTLSEVDSARLDINQAESELWPRFDVQVTDQVFIGGDSHADDDKVRGGLFMRYDFQKAFFRSDAAAAARMAQQKICNQANGLMMDLAYTLFDQFVLIRQLDEEVQLRESMTEQARQGALTARKMNDFHVGDAPLVWEWASLVQTHQHLLRKVRSELEMAENRLGFMLGLTPGQPVEITDYSMIADALDPPLIVSAKDPDFLKQVWQRRVDSRMAEMDLFLAEMRILEAKRKRLPRLSGSVGWGSFDVDPSEDRTAPATVELAVRMPLLDWGDIGRSIQKAENHRDWVQRRIQLLVRRLQHEILESHRKLQDRTEASRQTYQTWQEMQRQAQANQRLLRLKRIQPLDAIKFQLDVDASLLAYRRCRMKQLQAKAVLKRHLGFPLVEGLRSAIAESAEQIRSAQKPPSEQP